MKSSYDRKINKGLGSLLVVRKPDFPANLPHFSAKYQNFPQTRPGLLRGLYISAEAFRIPCHDQAGPCAFFLPAA